MIEDDLDKITWGEYKRRLSSGDGKSSLTSLSSKCGFSTDKLIQIVQASEMQGFKMFVWVACLGNYVRVYRNSMINSIKQMTDAESLTVRKEYREVYFR